MRRSFLDEYIKNEQHTMQVLIVIYLRKILFLVMILFTVIINKAQPQHPRISITLVGITLHRCIITLSQPNMCARLLHHAM